MKALKSHGSSYERNLSDVRKFDNRSTEDKGQGGDQAEEGRTVRPARKAGLGDSKAQTTVAQI